MAAAGEELHAVRVRRAPRNASAKREERRELRRRCLGESARHAMTAAQIMCGSGRERSGGSDCAEVLDEGVVLMVRIAVAVPVAGANKDGAKEQVVSAGRAVQARLTVPL